MGLLDHRSVERWEPFPQCIAVDGLECRPILNLSRNIGHPALSTFAVLTFAQNGGVGTPPGTEEESCPSATPGEPPRTATSLLHLREGINHLHDEAAVLAGYPLQLVEEEPRVVSEPQEVLKTR